jgi:hypothetical protein
MQRDSFRVLDSSAKCGQRKRAPNLRRAHIWLPDTLSHQIASTNEFEFFINRTAKGKKELVLLKTIACPEV